MFVGVFKLTSDREGACLRIDIDPENQHGLYALTDSNGSVHKWYWDLSESGSETPEELAGLALRLYLHTITEAGGWNGTCVVVLPAFGLDILDSVIDCHVFDRYALAKGALQESLQ